MANQGNVPDIMGEMMGRIPFKAPAGSAKLVRIPAESPARCRLLVDKLKKMRLTGMALALEAQLARKQGLEAGLVDQLERLVEQEASDRRAKRMLARIRKAGLTNEARLSGLDYSTHRDLDHHRIQSLARFRWLEQGRNLAITGPVGAGKTYLAQALTRQACLKGFSTLFRRLPELLRELEEARRQRAYAKAVDKLAKYQLLTLDDWGLGPLDPRQGMHLLEVLEKRHPGKSTLVTSHAEPEKGPEAIQDQTIDDSVSDRLFNGAEIIKISGPSLRSQYPKTGA